MLKFMDLSESTLSKLRYCTADLGVPRLSQCHWRTPRSACSFPHPDLLATLSASISLPNWDVTLSEIPINLISDEKFVRLYSILAVFPQILQY